MGEPYCFAEALRPRKRSASLSKVRDEREDRRLVEGRDTLAVLATPLREEPERGGALLKCPGRLTVERCLKTLAGELRCVSHLLMKIAPRAKDLDKAPP